MKTNTITTKDFSESASPLDNRPTFAPSSTMRKVRNLVAKIFFDFWASFFARIKGAFISSDLTTRTSDLADNGYAKRFAQTHLPLNQSLKFYLDSLDNSNFTIVDHFSHSQGSSLASLCRLIEKAKSKVFVPLIIKGRCLHHIVTLYIDKESKSMEYFDSMGLTIMDRKGKELLNITDENKMEKVATTIASQFDIRVIRENRKKVQRDVHNCGVYVASYIKQKIQGNSSLSFPPPNTIREECIGHQ